MWTACALWTVATLTTVSGQLWGFDNVRVRLVGGRSSLEGRVEVRYNGAWGTVCDDGWNDRDAGVICSMLGFSRSLSVARSGGYFPGGTGRIDMDDVNCVGSELSISDCNHRGWRSHNCGHSEDAGVTCALYIANDDVRLVGGGSALEGRVEIKYKGAWGTVCDDEWDNNDAGVVCSMLGYSRALSVAREGGYFQSGTGRILLDNVNCTGSELSISSCTHEGWTTHNCGHNEDAGVTCAAQSSPTTAQIMPTTSQIITTTAETIPLIYDNVRLVGGRSSLEGRVEIRYNGAWGTVCDDDWDNRDAGVICYMLGFSRVLSVAREGGYFQSGTGRILLDNVNCTGSELSISSCTHDGWTTHNCGHNEDAGVTCAAKSSPTTAQIMPTTSQIITTTIESISSIYDNVRLVGGRSSLEGRVEIRYNGAWGTVCDDDWDNRDAGVICYMLGFSRSLSVARSGGYFPAGTGRINMDDVNCVGSELSISDCNHRGWRNHNCGHSEDAGVSCAVYITNDDVRLVGGGSVLEGRVEIKYKGSWGTVCDDDWDNNDAGVVCSMLGYSRSLSFAKQGGYFPSGTGRILLDNVNCAGSELSISNCTHEGWTIHNCGHHEDAGVTCTAQGSPTTAQSIPKTSQIITTTSPSITTRAESIPTTSYSISTIYGNNVRLRGGSSAREGRVEVKNDGIWRTVCDKGWDDSDAAVVCSMLGYSRFSAVAKRGGVFPGGSGLFIIKNVRCNGNENSIAQCHYQQSTIRRFGTTGRTRRPIWHQLLGTLFRPCSHSDDAGVVCSSSEGTTNLCGSADILFIMDASGSVGRSNFRTMKNFVKNIISSFNSTKTRFSVITYGRDVESEFNFGEYRSKFMTLLKVDRILYTSGRSTNTHKALEYARRTSFISSKSNVAKIVILLTDGKSNNPSRTTTEASLLRRRGVHIFSIGIGSGPNLRELNSIASDPDNDNVFSVRSFTYLSSIKSAVSKRTCEATVDGGFTEWSTWSVCSVSCNGGYKSRIRTCTNPVPSNNGNNCTGEYHQLMLCQESPCIVDGGLSSWSAWGQCSTSCGRGVKERSRTCTNPRPSFGGRPCNGSTRETQICNSEPCAINGGFSSWSSWTNCSVTCGGGIKTRTRSCSNPAPAYGGEDCIGDKIQISECLTAQQCPVDGGYSDWESWSPCNRSCGSGIRERFRKCDNPLPSFGGTNCTGPNRQEEECYLGPCPVDGGFSNWSNWSTCSVSCEGGQSRRERFCTNPKPAFGGQNCTGPFFENRSCSESPCPINGGFSEWSDWSQCSKSCGDGSTFRQRLCNNPTPSYGGLNCQGEVFENKSCHEALCPVNGGFSLWSPWSVCSVSCGVGTKERNRSCSNPEPAHGGTPCLGTQMENQTCVLSPCPINGNFSSWGEWSQCSVSCNGGITTRQRTCTNPEPAYGGNNCSESYSENKTCSSHPCPIDGNYTTWGEWSACSKSCGGGISVRLRTCSNPEPAFGGQNCSGSKSENRTCSSSTCPPEYSAWGEWSHCTKTCGTGQKTRNRTCSSPGSITDGESCPGLLIDTTTCNTDQCPGCASDQFMCANKEKCISEVLKCDGIPDCQDESDETEAICEGVTEGPVY